LFGGVVFFCLEIEVEHEGVFDLVVCLFVYFIKRFGGVVYGMLRLFDDWLRRKLQYI
jgi:hypothetical protein